jgi:hypothetical protein
MASLRKMAAFHQHQVISRDPHSRTSLSRLSHPFVHTKAPSAIIMFLCSALDKLNRKYVRGISAWRYVLLGVLISSARLPALSLLTTPSADLLSEPGESRAPRCRKVFSGMAIFLRSETRTFSLLTA